MVEITHRDVAGGTFEVGNRQVSLSGSEIRIEVPFGAGGWVWTYQRPTSVFLSDDPAGAVPLRDHVMLTRIAFVLVAIAMFMRRR